VSHINGVWPVLSVKQLFAVRNIHQITTKPLIESPTLAFFLAETCVYSEFQAAMSELKLLVKTLQTNSIACRRT